MRTRIRGHGFCLLLYLLLLLTSAWTTQGADSSSSSSSALVSSRGKVSIPQQQQLQPQNVVQIIETEVYDGKTWLGHKSRWSDVNGEESEPPPTACAPTGFHFEGDWKIVTSSNRDSLGWEYIWAFNQPAMRRRLWLRTIVSIPKQPPTSLAAILREQWNFKGFAMSFYKSLTFANSFGMAFRLPIFSNIDWWERHPALPSFSTAVAGYFPWAAVYQISGSLNVDFLAWLMGRSIRYALYGISVLLLAICQFLFLPLAVLLYPARRQLVLPTFPLPTIPKAPPIFSLTISQRLGMSLNWRLSLQSGYEFRVAYYYECMPTVLYLTELFHGNKQITNTELTNWLRRKAAAFGLSCGAPLPVPPHYFCTAALSVSGFYFRAKQQAVNRFANKENLSLPTNHIKEEDPSSVMSSSTKLKLSTAAA
jgi:hypothetical protein